MCEQCNNPEDEEGYSEEFSQPGTNRDQISPTPLILQDMLCTLAKRVLDDLDQQGSLVDMFANWSAEKITTYEQEVEYAHKVAGNPMVDEDHVMQDDINETPL